MRVLTVRTGQLRVGSSKVTELRECCVTQASEAVGALVRLAGCAGNPEMESALLAAARQGTAAYFAAAKVYELVGQVLSAAADSYDETEHGVIRAFQQ